MEEAEARRAVRKALSEARANSLFSSLTSSSVVRGCQKKSEQTLAFAKLTDTLGECLEKMKEKDVLSLPILDLEKKTTKDSFHGFVSVESCLRVFLENMAVFLVGRKQEPFCVSQQESAGANPRVMPPMIEELGLQPGDVSRFGCQYGGDVPAKKTREDEEDPIASTFHATVQSVLDRLTANPRSRIVVRDSETILSILKEKIAKIPRAHRCLVERLDGTSHAKHDVLSCTDIVKYLNENVEVQAALANVCLADVPYLFRKGFTVLKSGEKIYRDETLFVTNNDALRQQSALDFFPDIVGEKVSVCFVTTVPSSFVTPRPRDFTVHVRGDITSSDLRGMNIENLSMLKSDPLSFAATMRRRHHRDQTTDIGGADVQQFQSVDPKATSLKDVMVLFANGCRRVYVVNGDLTGSSGVLDARNFLVGLTLQDEDIECVVSEGSQ
ncbi:unnamed protein product [Bathycoccus prasinos]|jgi:hypothetical protein